MTDFIQGENWHQSTLFPELLDEYIDEDSAVRVIDVYGYPNRVQSSRLSDRDPVVQLERTVRLL